jgi:hypothetical protein
MLLLYLKALLFWILGFGVQSVGSWLTAKPEDYLVSPGPLDNFMPIEDPGLFLFWCVTIVPLTAAMFRRTDQPNEDRT